jgi:N-carbamoyl-L-amino-acid hydrolase
MGSSTFVDPARLSDHLGAMGVDGVSVSRCAGTPQTRFAAIPLRPDREMACFVELHIEQGPVLESRLPLAIVKGIQGVRWYITCHGVSAHAGTTPMTLRQDAMTLAREQLVRSLSRRWVTQQMTRCVDVWPWQVTPNAINTIPSSVRFTLDFRHPSTETLARLDAVIASLA